MLLLLLWWWLLIAANIYLRLTMCALYKLKHFVYVISFNSHANTMNRHYHYHTLYRWGKRKLRETTISTKIIQLVISRGMTWTQLCLIPRSTLLIIIPFNKNGEETMLHPWNFKNVKDFPGDPGARLCTSTAWDTGSIPSQVFHSSHTHTQNGEGVKYSDMFWVWGLLKSISKGIWGSRFHTPSVTGLLS